MWNCSKKLKLQSGSGFKAEKYNCHCHIKVIERRYQPPTMQTLPSFLQSLIVYALTSPTSMAIRNSVSDRITSASHYTPKTETQSAFAERSQYLNFLLELLQSAQREELRRQNLRRLKFGSWVKRKTASSKFKSKHGHSYFPRDSRARLDRMPLAFGKRANSGRWKTENGDEFTRKARDRMDRMPLTFGKRFLTGMQKDTNWSPEANDIVTRPGMFSNRPNSFGGDDGSHLENLERRSNRLTRMPITFGKRRPTHLENDLLTNSGRESGGSADNEKWQEGSFPREGRTSLSRMPLTFGRKKKPINRGKSLGQNGRHENLLGNGLIIDFPGRLNSGDTNQNPSMAPPRDVKNAKSDDRDAILDATLAGTLSERHLHMRKNDLRGDTSGPVSPVYIYPYDEFSVQRKSVLDRMPFTFGKRDESVSDGKLVEHDDLEHDRTATGQDRRWLYNRQVHGNERQTFDQTKLRSRDDMSRVVQDGTEWRDAH